MKYLLILTVWALAWWLPQLAGPGYDDHYHLWQALVSLGLMAFVLCMTDEWWRAEFAAVCVLQILHAAGDFFLFFPAQHYNDIQSVLNWLELTILLGAGGGTILLRWLYGYNAIASDRNNRSNHSSRIAAARRWNE